MQVCVCVQIMCLPYLILRFLCRRWAWNWSHCVLSWTRWRSWVVSWWVWVVMTGSHVSLTRSSVIWRLSGSWPVTGVMLVYSRLTVHCNSRLSSITNLRSVLRWSIDQKNVNFGFLRATAECLALFSHHLGVCPSVYLSHSWSVSKRCKLGSRNLYYGLLQGL